MANKTKVNEVSAQSIVRLKVRLSNAQNHFFQPKLTTNQPNHVYEQEADAVAERIMRLPVNENHFFKPASHLIQKKCAHCEEEKEKLQMKEENNERRGMTAPPLVNDVINSNGQSLDVSTRDFMESRFGYDFGDVRIHDDSVAHQSSAQINALAYTHGNHVVFGSEGYQPNSSAGKSLIAHELVHVLQQSKSDLGPSVRRSDSPAPLPLTDELRHTKSYEIDIIDDVPRQVATLAKAPIHVLLSYQEASESFTVTFPLAWAFVHAWNDSQRKEFVAAFEAAVLRVWQDRFLLTERGGKHRSAHVYIKFDERIVLQQKTEFDEGLELSRFIQSAPTPWLMDVRQLKVRANVSGYTVQLDEDANKPHTDTGEKIREGAKFSEKTDSDKKTFTQTASPHEFGHMIGLGDEYLNDYDKPVKSARRRINDRIMNVGENVTRDVYSPFADWLSGLTKTTWSVGKKVP